MRTLPNNSRGTDPGQDTGRRARLLLLAYACSPLRGSEAAVGWNRALQAARWCDTWVLCEEHEGFGPEIRQYLAQHGCPPGLKFHFFPMSPFERWLGRWPRTWYIAYHRWHRRAAAEAARLHGQISFDLVQQLNFNGFREPSYLWQLDAPFIWGPVGGTQVFPRRFLLDAGGRVALEESIRTLINGWQLRYSRRVRQARRRAARIICANSTGQRDFHRLFGIATDCMTDTGVAQVPDWAARPLSRSGRLQLLWSGLLIHRKALHLLLRALAQVPAELDVTLRVVGDGPMKKRWQKLATQLGVAQRVRWEGWVTHAAAQQACRDADAFVFTSLRDTTGAVLHEAMAAGLPVICLDHQGAADIVTAESGMKVPVTTPAQVVRGLADAIQVLARDVNRRQQLSQGAWERAQLHTWDALGARMTEIYRQVLVDVQSTAELKELSEVQPRAPQPVGPGAM